MNVKIQSTTLNLNKTNKIQITAIDLVIVLTSFLLGLLANNAVSVCLNYVMISYFYHRYTYKSIASVIAYLTGTLMLGTILFYQHILILIIFTIFVALVKALKCNLYSFFPAVVSFVTFLASLLYTEDLYTGYTLALISYITCLIALKYMNVGADIFRINGLIFGILGVALVAGIQVFIVEQVSFIVIIFLFVYLALILDMTSLIVLMMLSYGILVLPQEIMGWAIGIIFINTLKDCGRGAQLFGFVLPVFLVSVRFDFLLLSTLLFLIGNVLTYSRLGDYIEQVSDERFERQQLASREKMLEHQLNQFAQIFLSIAQFFSVTHKSETKFLCGMAKSMELMSSQLKQTASSTQNEAIKIYNLLKGYQYAINRVYVNEGECGQKQISLYLDHCTKDDVNEVILPLLQMVIDRNLSLTFYETNPLLKSSVKIELNGIKPLQIVGHILSVDKDKITSGDTCSMYKIKQNTICTLSDGMGSGEQAKQFSNFITMLTQRLLSVGIPVEMAVKSMNSILRLQHEETFATLDVMVFDAYRHQVFLSKSGACATYLIRDNTMIKIQGESLPLGIIHEIEADCFRLQCQDNDVFIMISDGIEEAQLESWINNVSGEDIKSKLETSLSFLKTVDDVSVLLAEVAIS